MNYWYDLMRWSIDVRLSTILRFPKPRGETGQNPEPTFPRKRGRAGSARHSRLQQAVACPMTNMLSRQLCTTLRRMLLRSASLQPQYTINDVEDDYDLIVDGSMPRASNFNPQSTGRIKRFCPGTVSINFSCGGHMR